MAHLGMRIPELLEGPNDVRPGMSRSCGDGADTHLDQRIVFFHVFCCRISESQGLSLSHRF